MDRGSWHPLQGRQGSPVRISDSPEESGLASRVEDDAVNYLRAGCSIRKPSERMQTMKQMLKSKEAITHWLDKWERTISLFAKASLSWTSEAMAPLLS